MKDKRIKKWIKEEKSRIESNKAWLEEDKERIVVAEKILSLVEKDEKEKT